MTSRFDTTSNDFMLLDSYRVVIYGMSRLVITLWPLIYENKDVKLVYSLKKDDGLVYCLRMYKSQYCYFTSLIYITFFLLQVMQNELTYRYTNYIAIYTHNFNYLQRLISNNRWNGLNKPISINMSNRFVLLLHILLCN